MTLTLLFGALVGLALGLTGGGGSIFAVPLLIYGLGAAPHAATTVSLAAVAVTAFAGAADGARAKLVEPRPALVFALTGMLSAPAGVALGRHAPDQCRRASDRRAHRARRFERDSECQRRARLPLQP